MKITLKTLLIFVFLAVFANFSIYKLAYAATSKTTSSSTAKAKGAAVAGDRTIKVYNKCNYNVWLGLSPTSSIREDSTIKSGATNCKQKSDCRPGADCVVTGGTKYCYKGGAWILRNSKKMPCNEASNCLTTGKHPKPITGATCKMDVSTEVKQCYWSPPTISGNNFNPHDPSAATGYEMKPKTGEATLTVKYYKNTAKGANASNIFGGATITGRTGCKPGYTCEVGGCTGSSGGVSKNGGKACNPGMGFNNPASIAEYTFNSQNVDYYDLSLINGVSIPIEFSPDTPLSDPNNPLSCGIPGYTKAGGHNGMGACSWEFTPPSDYYNLVKGPYPAPAGPACSKSNCTQKGYVCGLTQQEIWNPSTAGKLTTVCGKHQGYWTADTACGYVPTFNIKGAPFYCSKTVTQSPGGAKATVFDMLGCDNGPGGPKKGGLAASCYDKDAKTSCCGCVDWSSVGIKMPGNVPHCKAINPNWTGTSDTSIQNKIEWTKKGCPSGYSYPFDDKTSLYTCTTTSGQGQGVNNMNYTLTFCPGNTQDWPAKPKSSDQ